MKRLLLLFSMFAAVAVTSCDKNDAPEDNFLVLTFEDNDYKGTESNYWSSLIDEEYFGSLLYSDAKQYSWTDDNNTNLNGVVNEGYGWFDPYPIVWYYSAGGIAVSNHYTPVVSGTAVTYEEELSVSNGSEGAAGHNGSANFAVVFDGAAGGMGSDVYLAFADEEARTIDHLYISSTSYLESVALDGNGSSPKLGADNYFNVVATGYDAEGKETKALTYNFAVNGKLVKGWNKWDLSALGNIAKVKFNVKSDVESKSYPGSPSLPVYFAIDDVAVVK